MSIDHNEITMGIFLDLSKALNFDTLNHDILFYKLEHYGIRGTALEWTKSYFSEHNSSFSIKLHPPLIRL